MIFTRIILSVYLNKKRGFEIWDVGFWELLGWGVSSGDVGVGGYVSIVVIGRYKWR